MASPNERLFDDSTFVPFGETRGLPNSLGQLLAELELTTSPEPAVRAGVSRWLSLHTPSQKLARSIRRRGYGDLLKINAA
ncbi:hypothetical protein BKA16_001059 [Gordonia humi]|uniref:Uncharacterized protein n=1 Tax=Gordonia humi TaxID=686429 RepID=A0A840F4M2_9ACTN|nr:hypothetical protein [Gordonia humi]